MYINPIGSNLWFSINISARTRARASAVVESVQLDRDIAHKSTPSPWCEHKFHE